MLHVAGLNLANFHPLIMQIIAIAADYTAPQLALTVHVAHFAAARANLALATPANHKPKSLLEYLAIFWLLRFCAQYVVATMQTVVRHLHLFGLSWFHPMLY